MSVLRELLPHFVQTILFYMLFILGFLIAVPVGITSGDMEGNCLLYTKAEEYKKNLFKMNWGAKSNCNYIISINVIFGIFYGCFMGASLTFGIVRMLLQNKSAKFAEILLLSPLAIFVTTVIHGAVSFLSLISTCILTVGLKKWCSSLMDYAQHHGHGLDRCRDAQGWVEWKDVDGTSFYTNLNLAMSCSWVSLFVWLGLVGLGIFKIVSFRREGIPLFQTSPITTDKSSSANTGNTEASSTPKY